MTIFDLLFALLFLCTLVLLMIAAVSALRRKAKAAVRCLAILVGVHAIYFTTLVAASLSTKGQVLAPAEVLWSDDWGIAALSASVDLNTTAAATHLVNLQITSRAGRIAQREHGVQLYVTDDSGHRYDAIPDLSSGQTDALLQPKETISLARAFKLPADAKNPRLVISRGVSFPGIVIIMGNDSMFHERPSIRLADLPKP